MDDEERTSERGQCAIHPELAAGRICARCGNFMCAKCDEAGTRRACPACRARVDLSDFPIDRESFTVGGVLDHTWATFRDHGLVLSGGSFLYLIVATGFNILERMLFDPNQAPSTGLFAYLLVNLLSIVVTAWMVLGLLRMAQDALEGRPPDLTTLFSQGRKLWKWLVAILAMGALFAIPCGLLIGLALGVGTTLEPRSFGPLFLAVFAIAAVPMIYLSLGMSLAICEITYDDEVGPIEAIQRSWRMVRGHRGAMLGIGLVVWLVMVGGVLLCCVGMIPAYGYALLALAVVHRGLRNGMELPDPSRPVQF